MGEGALGEGDWSREHQGTTTTTTPAAMGYIFGRKGRLRTI